MSGEAGPPLEQATDRIGERDQAPQYNDSLEKTSHSGKCHRLARLRPRKGGLALAQTRDAQRFNRQ
jgi:hypothetical protein